MRVVAAIALLLLPLFVTASTERSAVLRSEEQSSVLGSLTKQRIGSVCLEGHVFAFMKAGPGVAIVQVDHLDDENRVVPMTCDDVPD